jgi:hypothetical protein
MQFGPALRKVLYDSLIKSCSSFHYSFKQNKEKV